jgi:hypothetical protein
MKERVIEDLRTFRLMYDVGLGLGQAARSLEYDVRGIFG